MPTFWDLPRDVRDRIYRFNLVQEAAIDVDGFKAACSGLEDVSRTSYRSRTRGKPYLFHLGTRAEREAAGIFFGENTFFLDSPHKINLWKSMIWPRHFKLIRKVRVSGWDMTHLYGTGYNESFRVLATLKSLNLLTLEIDEQESLERLLKKHATIKWHESLGLSPQLHLQALNLIGIQGLLSMRNVRRVDFLPSSPSASGSATGSDRHGDRGDIVGGFLDTTLRHAIARPANKRTYKRKGLFRFLDLPPEVRNITYGLLLSFPGVTYPTAEKPTSVTCQFPHHRGDKNEIPVPNSALTILAANHQIHNEAAKIFYQNDFVFSYPSHLQAFTLNLETERLRTIRSLTLFYKDHNEGGVHTMGVTLKLLRRMSGLKKFHLLVENHLAKLTTYSFTILAKTTPPEIHGVSVLFSLRDISDIQVRELGLEDCYAEFAVPPKPNGPSKPSVEHKVQMLKHFNHGLALAQQGVVVKELYESGSWPYWEKWPALGDAECGRVVGCLCGPEEDKTLEESEEETAGT